MFLFFTKRQTWIILVVAGVISSVMTGHSSSPTIISNYGVLNWAVQGKHYTRYMLRFAGSNLVHILTLNTQPVNHNMFIDVLQPIEKERAGNILLTGGSKGLLWPYILPSGTIFCSHRTWIKAVLTRVVAAMVTSHSSSPPIIHDYRVFHWTGVCEKK